MRYTVCVWVCTKCEWMVRVTKIKMRQFRKVNDMLDVFADIKGWEQQQQQKTTFYMNCKSNNNKKVNHPRTLPRTYDLVVWCSRWFENRISGLFYVIYWQKTCAIHERSEFWVEYWIYRGLEWFMAVWVTNFWTLGRIFLLLDFCMEILSEKYLCNNL